MSKYYVVCLLALSSLSINNGLHAQEILNIVSNSKKFEVGSKFTIQLQQNINFENTLLAGSYLVRIDDIELKNITVDNNRNWTIQLPNTNEIVGNDKKVKFYNTSGFFASIPLEGIYSLKPELRGLEFLDLYTDVTSPQDFSILLNKTSYADMIEVEGQNSSGTTGTILFARTNTPILDRTLFLIDEVRNKISFQLKIGTTTSSIKFKVYYTDSDFNSQSIVFNLTQVQFKRKYPSFKTFPITVTNEKFLYTDDFIDGNFQLLTFDFTDILDGIYTLDESPEFNVTYNGSNKITVPSPGVTNKKFEVKLTLKTQLVPKIYTVKLKPASGQEIAGEFELFQTPVVKTVRIGTVESTSHRIIRNPNGRHTISAVGEIGAMLHKIPDFSIGLIDKEGNTILLPKSQRFVYNEIVSEIDFRSLQQISVGRYGVVLVKEKDKREYRLPSITIVIDYPKIIDSGQTSNFELYRAEHPSSLAKRFKPMDKRIIDEDSPIIIKINSVNDIDRFGPQYLTVTATYLKNNGNEVKSTMRDENNIFVQIKDTIKYWDLKGEFDIDKLRPNDRINVTIKHAASIYGTTLTSIPETRYYYNYMKPSDRFGLTFSLPPYLIATRNVKRKTIEKGTSGEIISVTYDQDSKREFQHLTLNAGLGLKYRFKEKDYEDSRLGVGLYLLGLDFSNSKTRQEQINDPKNHEFIERGSFNILALIEYSFLNIDNPNLRVPLYIGYIGILDPVDNGSKRALAFGLGVDIRLVGKN